MTLADIIARREALEARAAARRARDAELAADPTPAPKAHAKSGRKRTEGEPAMQGRDWLSEAREDLARVDAAPKVQTRRKRPATAPEYASVSDALQREAETNRTEPTTKVGGNVVEAAAGDLEDSSGVGSAPQSEQGATPPGSLARVPGSSPGRRTFPKQPQARAEHWTVRMKRIDDTVMVCRLSQPAPLSTPYDLPTPVRDDPRPAAVAGCGPPGW